MTNIEEINKEPEPEPEPSKDINEQKDEVKQQQIYLNCYYCKMSTGILAAYIYVLLSITINIVNRVIFLHYDFEFDYTLLLCQQLVCLLFYIILSCKSKLFQNKAGELSFRDFWNLKYKYVGYALFFLFKNLISFLGYQVVTNIPMYVNLRKLVTPMAFIYQYFFKKQKIDKIKILVVILLTIGAILSGIDDYSTDFVGYLVVFCKNATSVINLEIAENFKKKNGVSNIKLLAYNSFILPPLLLIAMAIFGEFKELNKYFKAEHDFSYIGLFINLFISCSIVCVNTLSFFISNEKIKSLLTQLLSDTKYIFITLLSYFILKTFEFTWKNVLGLLISTSGAIIITISSMNENVKFKKPNKEIKIELSNVGELGIKDKEENNKTTSETDESTIDDNNNKDSNKTKIEDKNNNDNIININNSDNLIDKSTDENIDNNKYIISDNNNQISDENISNLDNNEDINKNINNIDSNNDSNKDVINNNNSFNNNEENKDNNNLNSNNDSNSENNRINNDNYSINNDNISVNNNEENKNINNN